MTDAGKSVLCGSAYIFVPNEDVRFCELPEGHEGKHREVTEWTDEDTERADKAWP